jgi:hypothetical protein
MRTWPLEETMKKILFVILLLMPLTAWAKPKPADYTITVHVQSSHMNYECDTLVFGHPDCGKRQHLNVIIDGKKYELDGGQRDYLLHVGDYKAKVLTDDSTDNIAPEGDYEYRLKYEFLFPNGKTRKYLVVGESE